MGSKGGLNLFFQIQKEMNFDNNMTGRIWKVPTGQNAATMI